MEVKVSLLQSLLYEIKMLLQSLESRAGQKMAFSWEVSFDFCGALQSVFVVVWWFVNS